MHGIAKIQYLHIIENENILSCIVSWDHKAEKFLKQINIHDIHDVSSEVVQGEFHGLIILYSIVFFYSRSLR